MGEIASVAKGFGCRALDPEVLDEAHLSAVLPESVQDFIESLELEDDAGRELRT